MDERIRERARKLSGRLLFGNAGETVLSLGDESLSIEAKDQIAHYTAQIETALAAERDAAMEQCCRDVCQACKDGVAVQERDETTTANGIPYWHYLEQFDLWAICNAEAIRSRVAAQGEK